MCLSEETGDWENELNLISRNNCGPRYGIRPWSVHANMGEDVTLTKVEVLALKFALNELI